MDLLQKSKLQLKILRWQGRRTAAAMRWGNKHLQSAPTVLANAMPKSGSHLIYQVVQGLTRLGPFVNPGFPPVNRDDRNEKLPDEQVLKNILSLRPGDTAYGYIKARQPYLSLLSEPGRAMVFVFRDPRDMIVSHVFYATQMHTGHGMHQYYSQVLGSMEERINAAIEGVEEPGAVLSPIASKYEGYVGWLDEAAVMCLRFEDLVNNRNESMGRILDYLERRGFTPVFPRQKNIDLLVQSIQPRKSGTFRKGQVGGWREYFTQANILHFKDLTGDLLVRLGYESSDAW